MPATLLRNLSPGEGGECDGGRGICDARHIRSHPLLAGC
jgi:hypothetical protein